LKWGGFPSISTEPSVSLKKEVLKNYLDIIIFRDIAERYNVRNTHLLKLIINYVLTNFASEFSVNGFIKKFQKEYRLNKETVFTYFSYLEDVGFLYYLPRFSYKYHQRYITKKNYIIDNGFIMLLSFSGMEISGRLLENLVFTELTKQEKKLFYYKDQTDYECDFVVTEEEKVVNAIQVCYKLSPQNRDREIRGIVSAVKKFDLNEGIIIAGGEEEDIRESS
jgi:predicted AAA+ superfamily ATPase